MHRYLGDVMRKLYGMILDGKLQIALLSLIAMEDYSAVKEK